MAMNKTIVRCKNSKEFSKNAANHICYRANTSILNEGIFSIALSGGASPHNLYQLLASYEYRSQINWSRVHIFWSDERCVPSTHGDSNYKLAFDALLSKINIPEENIHRIYAELEPPNNAASLYEESLKKFFPNPANFFDLCLLGLGTDGHTASIFPGATLDESRLVVTAIAPEGMRIRNRVTLTTNAINRSKSVAFIVSGCGKKEVVERVLSESPRRDSKLPAARISPTQDLTWFIDENQQ